MTRRHLPHLKVPGSEKNLEPKLKLARATAAERRIIIRDVGRRLRGAEGSRRTERRVAAGSVELRIAVLDLIQKIEDLGTELSRDSFTELPILHQRGVPG